MFNRYLPDTLYERLPHLYLIAAGVLALVPLAPLKWVAISALILATALTRRQRRVYREAERDREAVALMEKYRV